MKAVNYKAIIGIMFISMLMMTNLTMAQRGNGNGNGGNGYNQGNCNGTPGTQQNNGYRAQDGTRMLNNIPDVTDAQKEKVKKLQLDMKKDMLPLRNQLNEEKAKLNTLKTADKADINEINKQIDKINTTKTTMMKRSAKMQQDFRNVLTEDQRVYFDSQKGKRNGKGHRNGNRGNRGNRGNCGGGCNR